MTIYALSTGPGISGIAIIRVSGEDTKKNNKIIDQREFAKSQSGHIKKDQ